MTGTVAGPPLDPAGAPSSPHQPLRAPTGVHPGAVVAVCVALAVVSLPLPVTLGYDPWAWLVWGREVTGLDLSTTGGPSWKPLPVLGTAVVSLAGEPAPVVWTVAVRTIGLLTLVAVWRLATRLGGSAVAGIVAVAAVLLGPDPEARYVRLVLEGHSAPITAGLAVWAVDRHLAGRHRLALLLVTGLALDRPEAWPLLGLYALWLWRHDPRQRWVVVAAVLAVPLLWFGGDWWGSGDPWHGADTAQVDADDTDRLSTALSRTSAILLVPAWAAVGLAVAVATRARDRVVVVIAAASVTWVVTVVAMAVVLGYAAIGRFFLPASTLLAVLAGVGAVDATRWVAARRSPAVRVAVLGSVLAVSAGFAWPRVSSGAASWQDIEARHQLQHQLDLALDEAGGRTAAARCGAVAIDNGGIPRMALSWALDRHLGEITAPVDAPSLRSTSTLVVARSRQATDRTLTAAIDLDAVELGRSDGWAVYAVGCAEP